MPLFEVIKTYYCVAESSGEALSACNETGEPTIEVHITDTVDEDWWDSIPFGSNDDKTCGQIIQEAMK